jgi:hypothetical protein
MIEYDINDKSIKRDISFGQWFAKITCSIIIISAIEAAIVYNIWK